MRVSMTPAWAPCGGVHRLLHSLGVVVGMVGRLCAGGSPVEASPAGALGVDACRTTLRTWPRISAIACGRSCADAARPRGWMSSGPEIRAMRACGTSTWRPGRRRRWFGCAPVPRCRMRSPSRWHTAGRSRCAAAATASAASPPTSAEPSSTCRDSTTSSCSAGGGSGSVPVPAGVRLPRRCIRTAWRSARATPVTWVWAVSPPPAASGCSDAGTG